MPAIRAERLCPNAVFLPPDFPRYGTVSRLTRKIFRRHTDLVEPLYLDEAYLDVTANKLADRHTRGAGHSRTDPREIEIDGLGWRATKQVSRQDRFGLGKAGWAIRHQPDEVDSFLLPLPVGRLLGVGKVTEEKLKELTNGGGVCES